MPQIASPEQKQLIASLNTNPGWHELKVWTQKTRDAYLANLAQHLWQNPDAVTEEALREKAAFFRGMNVLLNQPFFSATQLKRALENTKEESE